MVKLAPDSAEFLLPGTVFHAHYTLGARPIKVHIDIVHPSSVYSLRMIVSKTITNLGTFTATNPCIEFVPPSDCVVFIVHISGAVIYKPLDTTSRVTIIYSKVRRSIRAIDGDVPVPDTWCDFYMWAGTHNGGSTPTTYSNPLPVRFLYRTRVLAMLRCFSIALVELKAHPLILHVTSLCEAEVVCFTCEAALSLLQSSRSDQVRRIERPVVLALPFPKKYSLEEALRAPDPEIYISAISDSHLRMSIFKEFKASSYVAPVLFPPYDSLTEETISWDALVHHRGLPKSALTRNVCTPDDDPDGPFICYGCRTFVIRCRCNESDSSEESDIDTPSFPPAEPHIAEPTVPLIDSFIGFSHLK